MNFERQDSPEEEVTIRVSHHDFTPEVLIVDDDPQVADVLQTFLEEEGFVVAHQGDGQSALLHIERKKPDVVLADMKMPHLDGVSLMREIAARWQDIAVILMSASESPVGLPVPFLQKPFDLDDVITTILNISGPTVSVLAKANHISR